jgi:hypothetical protein
MLNAIVFYKQIDHAYPLKPINGQILAIGVLGMLL